MNQGSSRPGSIKNRDGKLSALRLEIFSLLWTFKPSVVSVLAEIFLDTASNYASTCGNCRIITFLGVSLQITISLEQTQLVAARNRNVSGVSEIYLKAGAENFQSGFI